MLSVEIRCYLQKDLRQSAAAETPARTPSTPRDPISKGKSLLWERQERILNKICPFQINLYSGTHDRPRWSLLRGGGWWRWWLTVGWVGAAQVTSYEPIQPSSAGAPRSSLVSRTLIGAVDVRLPRAHASLGTHPISLNCSVSSVVFVVTCCTPPCAFMGSEPTGYVIIGLCFLWWVHTLTLLNL